MNTTINRRELISSMVDSEVTDEQFASTYALLKDSVNDQTESIWDTYHQIGDVLRSDELDLTLSDDFSVKFSQLLDQEPVVIAPQRTVSVILPQVGRAVPTSNHYFSRYVAMTSIAAAVMVAFIMTPQILPLLGNTINHDLQTVKKETSNTVDTSQPPMVQLANNHESSSKEPEFAPKLMNQIEMLRDPNLDSYLMAHQKVSPSFANNGRYVKKANIESPNDAGK